MMVQAASLVLAIVDFFDDGKFFVRLACCVSRRCKFSTGRDDRNREP